MNQPITEGDDTVGKVMLREPGHHTLLLHVRATRYVYYQIPQILPVPEENKNNSMCMLNITKTLVGNFPFNTTIRFYVTYCTSTCLKRRNQVLVVSTV